MGQAGTTAQEYALHCPALRHPDANVFRRLQQSLRETGSVTRKARVNAGRPPIGRTPSNEGAIIAAVENLTRYSIGTGAIPTERQTK
jgi:hypothetical protein